MNDHILKYIFLIYFKKKLTPKISKTLKKKWKQYKGVEFKSHKFQVYVKFIQEDKKLILEEV